MHYIYTFSLSFVSSLLVIFPTRLATEMISQWVAKNSVQKLCHWYSKRGLNHTLARMTLWPETLWPGHFGQNDTLARVTLWPVTLWPETLWPERHFGQCLYGC